ncbi:helix-turn-helix domain-containing protein [Sinomicrobium soli]|uniref:helix-turn-helix domain-containing protein n=1 Tax=Sinomicrobium sp. N-1-3-6 TaxID=2219864 RepID=UPI000DCD7DFC|nr:helix-turn-helix domain-containing protein [Sinomicrobium sp. N-1-3-6]RAV27457.1 hypothetical protein DN748_18460 [Sinomicrobium sp. N-1-3-6]
MVKIDEILKRFKMFFNLRTDIELAVFLGVKPNTIATWKARNSMDFQRVLETCEVHDVDLNALFRGDSGGRINGEVPLIPRCCQYSYVAGLQDAGFIKRMPRKKLSFPVEKKLRAFQVEDDFMSMSTGNAYVVGKYIEDADDLCFGEMYVMVNAVHGVFIGRIEPAKDTAGVVYVLNEDRQGDRCKVKMFLEEVMEIWKVTHMVFDGLPEKSSDERIFHGMKKVTP